MAQTPPPIPRTQRRRKPLNLVRIKSVIVFVVGSLTALGGAITGLGAQVAFAPMLTWMLGFNAEKAQATAMRYAAFAAAASVFGAYAAHQMGYGANPAAGVQQEVSAAQFWPGNLLLSGLLIFLGATIGAIFTAGLAPKPHQVGRRRIFQTMGVGLGILVISEARLHLAAGTAHIALWHNMPHLAWLALLAMGIVVGGLTQVMGLSGGVLMVPALFFLGGYTAGQAATLSLLVVCLAALLPAWSYGRRGLVDTTYATPAVVGGLFGGLMGGLLLPHLSEMMIVILFSGIAMFLSARELARMALERPNPPESSEQP